MKKFILSILMVGLLCVPAFALKKNTASQKWVVFCFDETTNIEKTGDAAQITGDVRIDGAAANAIDDTNPTELAHGYYIFDITAAESNGDYILIDPISSTGDVQCMGSPGAVWTMFPQTVDNNTLLATVPGSGGTNTWNATALASINAEADTALVDYDGLVAADTLTAVTTVTNLTNAPTSGDLTATMKTSVNAEVDTALNTAIPGGATADSVNERLVAIDDLSQAAGAGDLAAILTDTGTTLNTHLTDMQGGTFSGATDSLEAIRDRGDAAWTTGAGGNDRYLLVDTTIATLASQTSFTLSAGSADDDAYNGATIIIEDVSTSTQKAIGIISDYTGSSKTVALQADPGIFTMATTDKAYVLANNSLKPTVVNTYLDVTATGAAGLDWGNVENKTTVNDLTQTDIQLVDTVTTYTGNTLQTGDSFVRLGAPAGASVSADILVIDNFVDGIESSIGTVSDLGGGATMAFNLSDIEAQTDDIGVAGAGLTNINLPNQTMDIVGSITGNLSGSVGSVTGAVGSVTGAVGSVAGNVDGNVTGSVGSVTGHTNQTGDNYARLGAPAGASVSADIAAVKVDSAAILVDTGTNGVIIANGSFSGFEKNVAVTAFTWLMVDDTDHVTPETGSQAALRTTGNSQISKDGGAFTDLTNIATVTHVASGIYEVDLTATEMNAGSVVLRFLDAGTADQRTIYIKTGD